MTRNKGSWLFLILWGLLFSLSACASPPTPPSPGIGTGLAVSSEFEAFYDQYGGAPVFGFPITTSFEDPDNGRLVQYFQHFHLEFDPLSGTVSPRPLARDYAPSREWPAEEPSANGRQRLFPETGYLVQDEFLTFFEAHGDTLVFGPPITPQFDEGGKLVQYFQNAQLVWNPNAPPEFRVEVATLGSDYLWQFGGPPGDFLPDNSVAVREADLSAAVKEPILYTGEEQVLYVAVIENGSLLPVENAAVKATISYDGIRSAITLPRTDEFGRTQTVLQLPAVEPGQKVQIEVEVTNSIDDPLGTTTISFKTWW